MEEAADSKEKVYGKKPLWQWIAIYVIIAVVAYGLIYYFVYANKGGYSANQAGQYQTPSAQSQLTAQPSTTSQATWPSSSAVMQITVSGTEFAFTPSTIKAKAGQTVQLTFKNTGKFPHNLSISDLNVKTKTIQPGEEDTIAFTPDKIGSFPYICTVPGHADRGMKGTLVVK